MTDNKPLFFHHFPRLDIFRGLLLSPKKQTGDGFEHSWFLFVFSFPSLFSSRLRCCESLYLLKTTRRILAHSHLHVYIPSYNPNSNPSLTVWEWVMPRDSSLSIIFQNSSKLGQLTRMSNEISCNTVVWIMMPTPQDFSLLGSICLEIYGGGAPFIKHLVSAKLVCSLQWTEISNLSHCTQSITHILLFSAAHTNYNEVTLMCFHSLACSGIHFTELLGEIIGLKILLQLHRLTPCWIKPEFMYFNTFISGIRDMQRPVGCSYLSLDSYKPN